MGEHALCNSFWSWCSVLFLLVNTVQQLYNLWPNFHQSINMIRSQKFYSIAMRDTKHNKVTFMFNFFVCVCVKSFMCNVFLSFILEKMTLQEYNNKNNKMYKKLNIHSQMRNLMNANVPLKCAVKRSFIEYKCWSVYCQLEPIFGVFLVAFV